MRLDQYRQSKGLSYSALARVTGASHAAVALRWRLPSTHKDAKIPSRKFMLRILDLTDGAVQPASFYAVGLND